MARIAKNLFIFVPYTKLSCFVVVVVDIVTVAVTASVAVPFVANVAVGVVVAVAITGFVAIPLTVNVVVGVVVGRHHFCCCSFCCQYICCCYYWSFSGAISNKLKKLQKMNKACRDFGKLIDHLFYCPNFETLLFWGKRLLRLISRLDQLGNKLLFWYSNIQS